MSAERVDGPLARIGKSGGPPPGVPATGSTMLFDEAQRTAVVLQHLATAEDMSAGAQAFSAMDAAETLAARASVDTCELKLELEAGRQLGLGRPESLRSAESISLRKIPRWGCRRTGVNYEHI